MRIAFVILVLAGLTGATYRSAEAQYLCGDCTERFDPWPLKEHKIPASGAVEFAAEFERARFDHAATIAVLTRTALNVKLAPASGGVIVPSCDGVTPVAFVAL